MCHQWGTTKYVPPTVHHQCSPQSQHHVISVPQGVNIIGLGQFTFTHRKTDVGNNKYLLVQRPVFVLSERFAQQHQLSSTKHHLSGRKPSAGPEAV